MEICHEAQADLRNGICCLRGLLLAYKAQIGDQPFVLKMDAEIIRVNDALNRLLASRVKND